MLKLTLRRINKCCIRAVHANEPHCKVLSVYV